MPVVNLETHCLYHELDRAVPALFELPGVPIADSQIHRATEAVKRGCNTQVTSVLHFKAAYNPEEGRIVIAQEVHGKLVPLYGIKDIPKRPMS